MSRVVIVGAEGPLGQGLTRLYTDAGDEVVSISVGEGSRPEYLANGAGSAPIDLLVFADDLSPPDRGIAEVRRADMSASLHRLGFIPFRLAALLRDQVAAANGRVVLLSRRSASMESPDKTGRYLERPFRAAAHALWRSLSVEWQPLGIASLLVTVDGPDDLARLPATIAAAPNGELVDAGGQPVGW